MHNNSSQVESLFAAAAELSGESRKAFLDRECAGQEALRNQVDGLLRAHDRVDHPLDRPAAGHNELEVTCLSDSQAVGTLIAGRYKLLEQIGDGGMGTVWMAEQKEPVKRLVAVKLIKAGMDSKAVLARFEAERQALALMDHPNIAKVHDAGTDDGGRPYFAMELVRGLPLTEYCDARKLSVNERLDLFVQICSAVQHAHQKAIIHRDLKPTNVLVTEHDGKPMPKVIDFGLAKALNSSQMLTERTLHTAYGTVVGTPLYMAPEQVGINALDVDTRTDIYALGVILYELLTGTTPLEKARFKEAAWEEMKRLIREEEPPRPSTRLSSDKTLPSLAASRQVDAAKLPGLVRGELDWIVMKALDKERTRRYETANGLAKDVQRYLKGDAIEACPPTLGYRLRKAYRRNRSAVLVGSTFAAVLLVATVVSLVFGLRARQAEDLAARRAEEANANEEVARRQRDEIVSEQNARAWSDYVWSIQAAQGAWQQYQFAPARKFLDRTPAEPRGWEWHYLNRLCKTDELYSFGPEDGDISTVRYMPDGGWIVTKVSTDSANESRLSSVQVWDTARRLLFTLCSDVPGYVDVDISSDSQKVLVAGDNKVTIWDLESRTAQALLVEDPDKQNSFSACFSPDGTKIVITTHKNHDDNSEVALWDVATRKHIRSYHKEQDTRSQNTSFSADGQWVYANVWYPKGGVRSRLILKIWDVDTGEELLAEGQKFQRAWLSPDGSRLAALDAQNNVTIWRIGRDGGNRPILDEDPIVLRAHTGTASPRTFSRDSKYLLTAGLDDTVRIWDAATGAQLRVLVGADSMCDFSSDASHVVTWGGMRSGLRENGIARVWEVEATDAEIVSQADRARIFALPSPNGERLLVIDSEGTKICDARTSKVFYTLPKGRGGWSPDGKRIWISSDGNPAIGTHRKVCVYDAETFQLLRELEGVATPRTNHCCNADGSEVLTVEEDGSVSVWDTNTGEKWELAKPGAAQYHEASYSPDGRKIFIGARTDFGPRGEKISIRGGISMIDAETRKAIELETGDLRLRSNGTFSRDSRLLLALLTNDDYSSTECRIWDTTTGKLLRSFPVNATGSLSLEISPDSSRILIGGFFEGVRLIDVQSGAEVFVRPISGLRQAWFDQVGNKIIVDDGDKIRILDGTPMPESKQ